MTTGIRQVLDQLHVALGPLEAEGDPRRHFLSLYIRITTAIGAALDDGRFEDPPWVVDWDLAAAARYLDALAGHRSEPHAVTRPWRVAFDASPALPRTTHLLLAMNAHLNYDLPQALLHVVPEPDLGRPELMDLRRRDHQRIDTVLAQAARTADREARAASGRARLRNRASAPVNRVVGRRLLHEARRKIWHNTVHLHRARAAGPVEYRRRLEQLELLSAARAADLLTPGHVRLRLATGGFGVLLPPADAGGAGAASAPTVMPS